MLSPLMTGCCKSVQKWIHVGFFSLIYKVLIQKNPYKNTLLKM